MGLRVPLEVIKRGNRESLIVGEVIRTRRYLAPHVDDHTDDDYDNLMHFCVRRVVADSKRVPDSAGERRRKCLLELMAVCLANIDRIDQENQ